MTVFAASVFIVSVLHSKRAVNIRMLVMLKWLFYSVPVVRTCTTTSHSTAAIFMTTTTVWPASVTVMPVRVCTMPPLTPTPQATRWEEAECVCNVLISLVIFSASNVNPPTTASLAPASTLPPFACHVTVPPLVYSVATMSAPWSVVIA